MMAVARLALLLAVCGLTGCRGQVESPPADSGEPLAADGGEADAGEADAGEIDAGAVDAGEADAGTADAGDAAHWDQAVDALIKDMQLNEAPLLNAPVGPSWAKGAMIEVGGAPRGDATPYWWKPADPKYKSPTPWTTIAPWFVIYPGVGHAATNVRIKIYDLSLCLYSKSSHQWVKASTLPNKPAWAGTYGFNLVTWLADGPARVEPDGHLSYKLDSASHPLHGGLIKYDLTQVGVPPSEVGAVVWRLTSQLVVDDPAHDDDRAQAQLLVSAGADYYPDMATKMSDFAPMTYVPSVGGSRYGLAGNAPRAHAFSTIDPPGVPKSISGYVADGGVTAIPVAELKATISAPCLGLPQ